MRNVSSQSCLLISANLAMRRMPALLTRISSLPSVWTSASTARPSTSITPMSQPSCAKRSAMPRPIPEPAPVTTVVLPSSAYMLAILLLVGRTRSNPCRSAKGFAAVPIEEMQAARGERHAHRRVGMKLDLRVDARRDQRAPGNAHAEQELGAELLGDFDDRIEGGAVLRLRLAEQGVLRTHAEQHRAIAGKIAQARALVGHADAKARRDRIKLAAGVLEPHVEEIHGRRADEARHEPVLRPVVDLERRADLLDAPVPHHGDAVAERHRLDLVVGHVHRGDGDALAQALELDAHVGPELGIEVGQRLVEQKNLRMAHDAAPQRHALLLPAGELPRLAL